MSRNSWSFASFTNGKIGKQERTFSAILVPGTKSNRYVIFVRTRYGHHCEEKRVTSVEYPDNATQDERDAYLDLCLQELAIQTLETWSKTKRGLTGKKADAWVEKEATALGINRKWLEGARMAAYFV